MIGALLWFRRAETAPQAPLLERMREQAHIEETVKRFVTEIKQENQRIISRFQSSKAEWKEEMEQLRVRVAQLEQQVAELSGMVRMSSAESAVGTRQNEDRLSLKNRYKRVFELESEGLGAEEIAKRLGAGRGEVELILSLAAKGEGTSR